MPGPFRALAVDYDGTLTQRGPPSASLLTALARARSGGLRLVLVTGRILAELRAEFPDVAEHFDGIVAENGAVLALPGQPSRALAPPISGELAAALVARGVPVARGEVLLATDARHDAAVLAEITRLGLECHLVRNRAALMILPPGTSKGAGLVAALAELGLSHHDTIGVGDAENDHSLLDACEIGVAVGNAIDALKRHADVVLDAPAGAGVEALLASPLLDGRARVSPRRWQVTLGTGSKGPVRLPGTPGHVLVTGGPGTGKSHLAGLLAERWLELGYSVCVIDPEGDHVALGQLREVVVLGGRDALPAPGHLAHLFRHGVGGVVLDLSLVDRETRRRHGRDALRELQALQRDTGRPHWIVVDEAHVFMPRHEGACTLVHPGLCLVTYRPDLLCRTQVSALDTVLVAAGGAAAGTVSPAPFLAANTLGAWVCPEEALPPEHALLLRRPPEVSTSFRPAERRSQHVRHWHKYAEGQVAPHLRFAFRTAHGLTGHHAGNLIELHRELELCPTAVLEHHRRTHDIARWLRDVLGDVTLARDVLTLDTSGAPDEALRGALLIAIERRYLADGGPLA